MDPISKAALTSQTPQGQALPSKERVWQNIQMVCSLFDMAHSIKSLQLRRQFPEATQDWIDQEALTLIERGCA